MKRLWVLLPLVAGLIVSILVVTTSQPEPILVIRVGVGMALFLGGAWLTLLLAAAQIGDWLRQRQDRHSIEVSRREAEESRRRFIRRLDHEIKNPLTGLQAALVNLKEAATTEERQQAGNNARIAVNRLGRLLADLRKLSDLEERTFERLPVDVPGLLEEMVAAAQSIPAYESRDVHLLVSRVPWPLPPVTGDRDLLGLAFYNLIDNALKFTGVGESVEVRALEDGRSVVVEVADSGPGIPMEDFSSIFEELYRGENARGIEGSGLGLALVERIIARHDGQVSVRSRQEGGRGTVFTIRLPVTKM